MRLIAAFAAALLVCGSASAQRHKIGEINAETEEGKMLQAIGTEADSARKTALMEAFVGKFPKHDASGWVWSQLQQGYVKAGSFDKALEAGKSLLALEPGDIDGAYFNLKASEGKKDTAGVLTWAVATSDIARKIVTAPKAADEEEDEHKKAVDYARQVDIYTEYSLYATALAETDAAKVITLTETLEKRNDKSQYLPQTLSKYAWAARQANAMPAAVALGERLAERGQFNEDLLIAMADYYMNTSKNPDKVILYSGKITEVLGAKAKPEAMAEAEWEKKKTAILGLAHWMAGTTYGAQNKHPQADKSLRAALPLIQGNDQLMGPALFYLGLANYQMGKGKNAGQMADAVRFMGQCAAIKGPLQAQAQKNAAVMKKEMGGAAR